MKFKYLFIHQDGDVTGTNNESLAKEYMAYEWYTVIDTDFSIEHTNFVEEGYKTKDIKEHGEK